MNTPTSSFETARNGQSSSTTGDAARTRHSRSAVSREFHDLLGDFEELITRTTAMTTEDLARAKAQLGERITQARHSLENTGEAIGERARKSVAVTNEYVHEQPWKAIGIGAAVGLLLGVVIARR